MFNTDLSCYTLDQQNSNTKFNSVISFISTKKECHLLAHSALYVQSHYQTARGRERNVESSKNCPGVITSQYP